MIDDRRNIILDICGGTGAWSRPYKEAGYNVINAYEGCCSCPYCNCENETEYGEVCAECLGGYHQGYR